MRSMRWNWLALVVLGGIFIFIGVVGVVVGGLKTSSEPLFFFTYGGGLVVGGFFVRRWYRRYEEGAIATAAEDLEADREHIDS